MASPLLIQPNSVRTPRVSIRSHALSLIAPALILLLALGWAACSPAAAQTASFAYAQVALGSGWLNPDATAVDANGNLYVADTAHNAVVEIVAVNGVLPSAPTTITLANSFSGPAALALDGNGNLYVADRGNGVIKEIVATSVGVFPATPAIVTLASGLTAPAGVAVDANGNVFFAQQISGTTAIKEIAATSVGVFPATPTITSIGTGTTWNNPAGVAVDLNGNVYIAGNQSQTVSEILKAGGYASVKTLASGFTAPAGIAVDASGNVFVTDAAAGTVSEIEAVAGAIPDSPTVVSWGSGWSKPSGVSVDGLGNLFVADTQAANGVQEVMTSHVNFGAVNVGSKSAAVTLAFTFATGGTIQPPAVLTMGTAGLDFADAKTGTCTAQGSSYNWTATSTCTVLVTLTPALPGMRNGAVELVDSSSNLLATAFVSGTGIGPVAGFSPGSMTNLTVTGLATPLSDPGGPVFDAQGNLYLADAGNNRVLKLAQPVSGTAAATVVAAGVQNTTGVALDGAGNLYMVASGNSVMKSTPSGVLSTLDNHGLTYSNVAVAVDGNGNVYTADATNNRIVWFPGGGPAAVFYAGGPLNKPYGLAVDSQGNVFVANYGGNNIVEISQGVARILSSTYSYNSSQVSYSSPMAIALDGVGDVYVSDTGNDRMVMIPSGTSSAAALSTGANALSLPTGDAVSSSGDLVIIDGATNALLVSSQEIAPSLAFPNTAVGMASTDQSVALLNLGNSPLTFSAPATGSNPSLSSNFTLAPSNCPSVNAGAAAQSLSAGSSCVFDLTFHPKTTGAASGSLVLTDNASNGSTQTISLSGAGIAPAITLTPAAGTLTDGTMGTAYSQQFTASGGTAPYTYAMAITAGSLPAGIAFNSATGLLSGTPSANATFSFTVTATDNSSAADGGPFSSSAQAYTLTIPNPAITITPAALTAGTAGVSYAHVTLAASGGGGPYTFAITSGSLPPGLQLAGGVLSGTPTAVGTFFFTVTATDSFAKTGNKDYSITIGAPRIGLSPGSGALADGTAETSYSQQFTANGGTAPYAFSVSGGALPGGMVLSTAGLLTGTPATAGNYSFTVQAADSTTGSGAPYSASATYSLTTYAPIISVLPMNGLLPAATVGQTNYSLAYGAKGGNGSYSYALTGGALPPGMSLTGGVLTGAPAVTGNFTFTVTATDGEMFTARKTYSLSVGSPTITLAPANAVLGEGIAESAYGPVTFSAASANGGTAPYTYAITAGALPAGLSFTPGGVLSGIPAVGGTFYFTVTATDAHAQTGSKEFALPIGAQVIAVTTTSLLDAAVGIPYSQALSASGGSGTYLYTASGLPAWLTLDSSGLLHGTPAAGDIGGLNFTITATDADGFSGSRSFTPSVYAVAATVSGTQNLGTATMGGSPATGSLTFTFNGAFALGSAPVAVLTQGASGLDFSSTGKGTCVQGTFGLATTSCTVNVAFNPLAPGQRLGAVQLLDSNGNVIASQFVYGNGMGAVANYLPGSESALTASGTLQTPQSLATDASGNLYFSDAGLNEVMQLKQGKANPVMTASAGLGTPQSMAVDGAGNVYIADSANNAIWKVAPTFGTPAVVTSASVNAPAGGLSAPRGVAVDGAGNVYIADTGNGRILETSPSAAGGFTLPVQIPTYTTLKAPYAVAADRYGSLYIADFGSNSILIEPAGGTQGALGNQGDETKISTGVSAPTGVAFDANGNLYIANSGAANVLKATKMADGSFALPAAVSTVATLSTPYGIAVDGSGDIFIADSKLAQVYEENYSAAPAGMNFPTPTADGSRDVADGALGFTMLNFGNADLNFASATGIADATSSFTYDASKNCLAQGNGLSANSTCIFAVDFTPHAVGVIAGSLGLTYNNLSAASTTVAIPLSGTGVSTFVFTPPGGSALPSGVVGVSYSQSLSVSGGTAPYTYALANGALPAGVTLSASGALSGTPEASGTFEFTVTATDSGRNGGSASYSLAIAPDATVPTSTQDSPTQLTVTFQFSNPATVGSVKVLTQGATGLDFTDSGKGTCAAKSYNTGDQCTVIVTFGALYPGTRLGAVELLDGGGNIVAAHDISAVGTAPLALFSPGVVGSLSMKDVSSLGTSKTLNVPGGLALDPNGNVYLADILNDRVLKVAADGTTTVVATPGIALHYPTGLALDGAGNLYIANNADGQVVEVTPAGVTSILDNGALTITNNFSVAVDAGGNVYTTDLGNSSTGTVARIVQYPGGGTAQVLAITGVTLSAPSGVAVDGAGTVWIADNNSIVEVKSGTGTTLGAGTGTGTQSYGLSAPLTIAADGMGNLYVADGGHQRILQIPTGASDLSSAITLNLAQASLNVPFGLAISGAGDLYIADAAENSVVVSHQGKGPEFGFDTTVGVTSTDQSVTLMNVGNSALAIPAPASAGSNPGFVYSSGSFALDAKTTTCPQVQSGAADGSLAAGNNCIYAVQFAPAATGATGDVLKLTDNSNNVTGATQSIALEGSTIVVSPGSGTPATPYVLPAGAAGVAYNSSLAATFSAAGGTTPYSFGVSSGSLPRGLFLNPDGVLLGTPIAAASCTFTVKATDKNGLSATQAYSLVINAPSITLTPAGPSLPAGTVAVAYSQMFSASGGTMPYHYEVTGGSLPRGLVLSRGGELTGIPTATASPASFTITATDTYGETGSQAYLLTVNPPPIVLAPAGGSPTTLPGATAMVVYGQIFSASGGTAPFSYALTVNSGTLPAGLTLDAHTGILSGTPIGSGTVNFTITATDSTIGGPFTGSQTYALTIVPPTVTLAPAKLPDGAVGAVYNQPLAGSGGSGPYTFSVTAGSLPAGLKLTGGVLSGTPTMAGVSAGFTITATDTTSGAIASRIYTPTIFSAPATALPLTLATPEPVGSSTTLPTAATFTFHGSAIVNGFAFVTQGAANLDYGNAHAGSCTITQYNDGDTCTLNVNFKPRYPGQRNGAVELIDASGNILGAALVSTTGTGPVANILPATETAVASASSGPVALQTPQGLAVDASGNVAIADSSAHAVLRMTPAGAVTKLLDISSSLGKPTSVAIDGAGNIYAADSASNTIWKQAPPYTGAPAVVTSNTVNPPAGGLAAPGGVAVDGGGNVYFTSTSGNKVYEALLSASAGYSAPVAIPTFSQLSGPSALAVDGSGTLYIADSLNNRVLIEPAGGSTAAGQEIVVAGATMNLPAGLTVDDNGNFYVASGSNVLKVVKTGATYAAPSVVATGTLQAAAGVVVDGGGNLYISDATGKTVVKENYATPRAQQFAKATFIGSTDTTDGPAAFTVLNFGNTPLKAVSPGLAAPSDFPQVAGSGTPADCTAAFSLAANASCNLSIAFLPATTGSLSESFVVSDDSLNANTTQSIQLAGTGLPLLNVTWATPSAINYGTPLSAAQLNASSGGIAGTFVYTPAAGAILNAGNQTLSVTFTATDSKDYSSVTQTVALTVNQVAAAASLAASINPSLYQSPVSFTATVTSAAGTPTGTVTFLDGTTTLGSSTLAGGVAIFTTSALTAGPHTISAVYTGDTNFIAATSGTVAQMVIDFSIVSSGSGSGSGGSTQTVTSEGVANYSLAIAPTAGVSFPSTATLTVTGLPPGATVKLNTAGWVQQSSTSWMLPPNTTLTDLSLTVQVAPLNGSLNARGDGQQNTLGRHLAPLLLGLLLLPFSGRLRRAGKRMGRKASMLFLLIAIAVAAAGLNGCSSFVLTPQTENFTVTVSAGALSHSTDLQLIVK